MFPLPLADGSLIYSANPSGVELGLWWRSPDGTTSRRLTFGLGDYLEPRTALDGRLLVATRYENRQSLVRIEASVPRLGTTTALTDGHGGDLDPTIAAGRRTHGVQFGSRRKSTPVDAPIPMAPTCVR